LGVLAILENFVVEDKSNAVDENSWFPDGLLVAHFLLQIICMGSLFWALGQHVLNWMQIGLMCLSTGINSGSSAIVIAHEMIHRKSKTWRFMGQFLLLTAANVYFYIDHLKVHHKWVGTLHDPATSRYGEGLYSFFIRSTIGQIKSSYAVEAKRLGDEGSLTFSPRNYVIGSTLVLVTVCLLLVILFSFQFAIAFLLQGFFANFLLEYTNYIEHYGLSRKDNERVTEIHSWQTDKVISRFFLIDLSRHADHHYYASKPYHTLLSYEKSPVLPGGYVSMIYYAMVPPLFFRKMHPLIGDGKI
jgi:alkane 1-monooxygenase